MKRVFLHIGCGPKKKRDTTPGFNIPEWTELRLDIDPRVHPDLVGTMTDMPVVKDKSVDAIYSSHNVEHLYPHEVPLAFSEFKRVLRQTGFVVITCPDLQSLGSLIADDKLTEPVYQSPAGPIAPIDILFGHRPHLASGNLFMAHHCGFTERVLRESLEASSFSTVATKRRVHPYYDLWALATVERTGTAKLRQLAGDHFPD
jgi:SAM-dependent methyltransferase